MNRFKDALNIQQGACNPSGVARAIVRAIDEANKEGADTPALRNDPAIRLMVHQLAFLTNVTAIDEDISEYGRLIEACKGKAQENESHDFGGHDD